MNASLAAPTGLAAADAHVDLMTLEVLESLYARLFDYVWQSALRLGVSRSEVDDVVQETFLRAHDWLRGEPPRDERAWIFTVLRHVVHEYRRKQKRRRSEDEDWLEELSAPGRDPEARAEVRETARMLETLLDELDEDKRAILILAELEERTLVEIAEIMNLNINTAAARLRVARRQVADGIARHRARDAWRLR